MAMFVKEVQNGRRYFAALVIALVAILMTVGCGGGDSSSSGEPDTPMTVAEVRTEPTLPPPSSLKADTETVLTITAEELVRGITGNSTKKNIKEYFAKYADITGVVVQVEKGFRTDNYEVLLDGNHGEEELAFVMCKIFDYDQAEMDKISPGQTVTVHGQIKAMKEVPSGSGLIASWTAKNFRGQVIKPCEVK